MDGENGNEGVSQDGGEGVTMNFEDNPDTDGPEEVKEGTKTPEGADAVLEDRSRGAEGTHGIQDNTEGCQAPSGSGTNQDVMSETPIDGEESVVENTPQTLQTQLEHAEEATESETNRGGVPEIPVNNNIENGNDCSPQANNPQVAAGSQTKEEAEGSKEARTSVTRDAVVQTLSKLSVETNVCAVKDNTVPESSTVSASKKPSTTCDRETIANNQEGAQASEKAPDAEKQEEMDQSINSKNDTPPTDLVAVVHVADTKNAGSNTTHDIEKDGPRPAPGLGIRIHGLDLGKQQKSDQSNSDSTTSQPDLAINVTYNAGLDTQQDKDKNDPSSDTEGWVMVTEESKHKEHAQQQNISGPEGATLTHKAEDQNLGSKQLGGKEVPPAKDGEGRSQEEKDEEKEREDENAANAAKANKKGGKEDIKTEDEEPKQHIIRERSVSISLCTSAYGHNVKGLESYLNGLKKKRPELIKEVKIHQLPYNDLDSYRFQAEDPIDVMILCHSINNRRFAITDVMDALYDKYLPYCASAIGKEKMGVIVHDFDDMRDTVQSSRMGSFVYKQPKAFETTNLQITCGHIETEKQVKNEMFKEDQTRLEEFLKNASKLQEQMMDRSPESEETMMKKAKRVLAIPAKKAKSLMPWNKPKVSCTEPPTKQRKHQFNQSSESDVDTGVDVEGSGLQKKPKHGDSQTANASTSDANPDPPTDATLLQQHVPRTSLAASTTHTHGSPCHQSMSQSPGTRSHPRPISVSVCSSAYENNVKGLMSWFTDLQTRKPLTIADVKFRELPYNDIDSFKFPQSDPVDVMVLCHSVDNRGFSITDVLNAIYNKYLKYCHDVIGKKKLAVIVHDFKDLKPGTTKVKMESFRRLQPSTFEFVDTVIICGSLEVPGKIEMGHTEKGQLLSFLEKATSEPKENLTVRGYFW